MGRPGLYNDNINRAYPFIRETVDNKTLDPAVVIEALPDDIIADAGFMMGLSSGFEAGSHSVYLKEIHRNGSLFYFVFESDAPLLFGHPLVFVRDLADEDYTLTYQDEADSPALPSSDSSASVSASDSSASASEDCPPEPLWTGFLVTGRLASLAAILSSGNSLVRSDDGGVIEPALIHNVAGSYVSSFNLANQDRTRVDAPTGCPPIDYGFENGDDVLFVNCRCLRGNVRIKAGYNAFVRQETFDNAIEIGAAVGAGEGEPCESVLLFEDETPPEGTSTPEGSFLCNEVLRAINGVGGKNFNLTAGLGVTISEDVEDNRVIIDVNQNRLAVCLAEEDVSESVSESL